MTEPGLGDRLAKALPFGVKLTVRHVSSTPVPCSALFSAPLGDSPETTFCENHFFSVSITKREGHDNSEHELIVFGIEVLVYNTAHLTTIFVSKADSTGYLHLLDIEPKVSLLRIISSTFLSYLARTRQRPGVRLLLSLFARAQNQYLFPGSIENPGKHVLDDRGLIKWWCRVVDPILRQHEPESNTSEGHLVNKAAESAKTSATAFLIVPGCDKFETRSFFPHTAKLDEKDRPRWLNEYPVRQLCRNPDAPPRCLVPRFPDDPKTRFLIDLDDELSSADDGQPSDTLNSGQWRSVKSLRQFWEMMSFRQECLAGSLVGFLWLVVNLAQHVTPPVSTNALPEPLKRQPSENTPFATDRPYTNLENAPKTAMTESNPFSWPAAGRGHVVLDDADYKTAINFLLEQDFSTETFVAKSTKGWVDKVAALTDTLMWGESVVGTNVHWRENHVQSSETASTLTNGVTRKRKKEEEDAVLAYTSQSTLRSHQSAELQGAPDQASHVNVLSSGLIRKKKKT